MLFPALFEVDLQSWSVVWFVVPLLLHLPSGPLTRGCHGLMLDVWPLCLTLRWRLTNPRIPLSLPIPLFCT